MKRNERTEKLTASGKNSRATTNLLPALRKEKAPAAEMQWLGTERRWLHPPVAGIELRLPVVSGKRPRMARWSVTGDRELGCELGNGKLASLCYCIDEEKKTKERELCQECSEE
jgi:hypothetical protein